MLSFEATQVAVCCSGFSGPIDTFQMGTAESANIISSLYEFVLIAWQAVRQWENVDNFTEVTSLK